MNLFTAMEIASSGLSAQRTRMNALASNLANARTTRTEEGGPYRRKDPVFKAVAMADQTRGNARTAAGEASYLVKVDKIQEDQSPPQLVYDPAHPDADEQGYVALPNINVVEEMVNLITASRAYESGVTALQSIKGMARAALNIGA